MVRGTLENVLQPQTQTLQAGDRTQILLIQYKGLYQSKALPVKSYLTAHDHVVQFGEALDGLEIGSVNPYGHRLTRGKDDFELLVLLPPLPGC